MIKNKIQVESAKVLIMGLTFKENCPDLRNTRVVNIFNELREYAIQVDVMDPLCSTEEARKEYGMDLTLYPSKSCYDAILLAVGHQQFKDMGISEVRAFGKQDHVLYDLKYVFPQNDVDIRL